MSPRLRLLLITAAALAASSALILLSLTLLEHRLRAVGVQHFDRSVQARIHAMTNPALTDVMLALTWLGAIKIFASALALAVVVLAARGRHREAALLGGGIASAFVLNESLKLHFHRFRPQVPWSISDEHTFSFPSGHSLFAVVLYGTLAYLALGRGGSVWQRFGMVALAMLMPLGIGISRVYLGMHYPTDVLAGWLAGALWLAAIVTIAQTWPRLQSQPPFATQPSTNSHPPSLRT